MHEWHCGRPRDLSCVMPTPTFGVSWAWYAQFSRRLLRHYASFWGEAHVHAGVGASDRHIMSPGRLQRHVRDAWFKITLLVRRLDMGLEATLRLDGPPCLIIQRMWQEYDKHMRLRRVAQLSSAGPLDDLARVAVVDGNQKLTRRVCAELCAYKMRSVPGLGLCCLAPCPSKPKTGSAFCCDHARPDSAEGRGDVAAALKLDDGAEIRRVRCRGAVGAATSDLMDVAVETPSGERRHVPLKDVTPQALRAALHAASVQALARAQQRPAAAAAVSAASARAGPAHMAQGAGIDLDDSATLAEVAGVLCKTHKTNRRPAKRRCVVEAEIRPATASAEAGPGEAAAAAELVTLATRARRSGGFLVACASNGLVLDAVEFYGAESLPQRYFFVARLREQLGERLRVVVHDDACHVRRFADRRQGHNEFARSLAFPAITYVVDHFHSATHVDPWCRENCHPETPGMQAVLDGVKTSVCEATTSWLGRYKHTVRKMDRWAANFFLQEVIDLRNSGLVADLAQKQQAAGPSGAMESAASAPACPDSPEDSSSSSGSDSDPSEASDSDSSEASVSRGS